LYGDEPAGQQLLHFAAIGVLREEPVADAVTPLRSELIFSQENLGGIRIA
jgi:hypothetical protein